MLAAVFVLLLAGTARADWAAGSEELSGSISLETQVRPTRAAGPAAGTAAAAAVGCPSAFCRRSRLPPCVTEPALLLLTAGRPHRAQPVQAQADGHVLGLRGRRDDLWRLRRLRRPVPADGPEGPVRDQCGRCQGGQPWRRRRAGPLPGAGAWLPRPRWWYQVGAVRLRRDALQQRRDALHPGQQSTLPGLSPCLHPLAFGRAIGPLGART